MGTRTSEDPPNRLQEQPQMCYGKPFSDQRTLIYSPAFLRARRSQSENGYAHIRGPAKQASRATTNERRLFTALTEASNPSSGNRVMITSVRFCRSCLLASLGAQLTAAARGSHRKLKVFPETSFAQANSASVSPLTHLSFRNQSRHWILPFAIVRTARLYNYTLPTTLGWSGAGMQGREYPEKTHRQAASSSTIPTCENPGVIQPGLLPLVGGEQANRSAPTPASLLSPPTNANRVESPAGSPRIFAREIPMVGGFSRGSPVSPPLHSGAAPYSSRLTLICSHNLDVKSRPNPFTHTIACVTEDQNVEDPEISLSADGIVTHAVGCSRGEKDSQTDRQTSQGGGGELWRALCLSTPNKGGGKAVCARSEARDKGTACKKDGDKRSRLHTAARTTIRGDCTSFCSTSSSSTPPPIGPRSKWETWPPATHPLMLLPRDILKPASELREKHTSDGLNRINTASGKCEVTVNGLYQALIVEWGFDVPPIRDAILLACAAGRRGASGRFTSVFRVVCVLAPIKTINFRGRGCCEEVLTALYSTPMIDGGGGRVAHLPGERSMLAAGRPNAAPSSLPIQPPPSTKPTPAHP
ncbi:hypothetical protein PR048_027215 [Dryococelus australis]|uniref:Uncharacterized protein n=1 Tax=Dryococelus australis TaxID=614101 RepID=A0ABQ9GGJ9_9NEOP|nr:hypothetical protein PR048_027215 [Dryococelus australis]